MLSVGKILLTIPPYSPSSCIANKTIGRYALRTCDRSIDRRYGQWVPEKLLLDDEDVEKYKIDPRVKQLRRKIIYSDYLENKSLRHGEEKNRKLLSQMKCKVKARRYKDLMETPVASVSLKYLREIKDLSGKTTNGRESSESEKSLEEDNFSREEESSDELAERPIHMPYASTDRFERSEIVESESETTIPDLNRNYVELYEKYLETKRSTDAASLENETPSGKNTDGGLTDSASKVPPDWMSDYEQYNDFGTNHSRESIHGTPDPEVPVSSIPCGGCGAILHCQDSALPGYLPSELFKNQSDDILRASVCQRCHFLKYYKTTLEVTVPTEDYPALLSHIKVKKVAVILIVDLTDFPCSIWSGLKDIVHEKTNVFVVGNKIDLLPVDGPNCLKNVQQSLTDAVFESGLNERNVRSVSLVSAKTGYGVEQLINKLHKVWNYKGDVYLIGCTNVGKSSLFNALLRSDFCKIQAASLVQRATVSPWPGTTLNLLKFPILNPSSKRLWMRTQRMLAENESLHEYEEYRREMFKDTKKMKYATLQGHIGTSFDSTLRIEGDGYMGQIVPGVVNETGRMGLDENHKAYRDSRWCYDTPGAMLPDQVLHFLTTEELLLTLPRRIITPRSFDLYASQSLFLAGLGRLDFVSGTHSIMCTVFASHELPVTICSSKHADELYESLLQTEALAVPINDPERLKLFPALQSKTFEFTGTYNDKSSVDVVLSSAGWIALTVRELSSCKIRAWTPEGKGIHLRTPAMLSRSVQLRGYKIPQISQAYAKGKAVYTKR